MIKVVGIVKFLSIVLFLGILGLSYAYLPVKTAVLPDSRDILIDRGTFFYMAAGFFTFVNIIFSYLSRTLWKKMSAGPSVQAWLLLLTPVVNIYLAMLVGFVAVLNNPIDIPPASYSYLNYLGPILIMAWLVGLIVVFLKRRKATI